MFDPRQPLVHLNFYRRMRVIRLREVALVMSLSLLAVLSEVGGMTMILPILSFVEQGRNVEAFANSSRLASLLVQAYGKIGIPVSILSLSAVAFVFVLIRQTVNYFNSVEIERVKWVIGRRLAVKFFAAVLGSSARFIRTFKAGEFMTAADFECQAAAALARIYGTMWMQLVSLGIYGTVLLVTAPLASVVAGLVIACSLLSLGLLIRITRRLSMMALHYRRTYADFLNERFRAWKLIKLGNAVPLETSKVDALQDKIVENQIRQLRVSGMLALIFVPAMTGLLLVMLYVFVEVLRLDVATVVLFILVLIRLTPISQSLQGQLALLAQFSPAQEHVAKVFSDAAINAEKLEVGCELTVIRKNIVFENVTFTYPERDDPALRDISVSIPACAMTALVGASGAGKSTLVDLVPRLIEPQSGRILIDGHPIRELSLGSLRRTIAYVPQEPFLFDASIADNISYLRPDAPMHEIVEAAKLANADEFIAATPDGYRTTLGEQGAKLSGGQKQRIVLARAFLSNASLLILDEPTSALDYESEAAIQRAVESLVSTGRLTVIVIAHRLSTVRNADFVVQMRGGEIIKTGTAAEVLDQIIDVSAVLETS